MHIAKCVFVTPPCGVCACDCSAFGERAKLLLTTVGLTVCYTYMFAVQGIFLSLMEELASTRHVTVHASSCSLTITSWPVIFLAVCIGFSFFQHMNFMALSIGYMTACFAASVG